MKQTNKQDKYPEGMLRTLQGERETKPVHRDPESHKDRDENGSYSNGTDKEQADSLKKE